MPTIIGKPNPIHIQVVDKKRRKSKCMTVYGLEVDQVFAQVFDLLRDATDKADTKK